MSIDRLFFAKGVLFLLLVTALTPFGPSQIAAANLGDLNVDVAFQLALPFFFENSFQFGDEIIFTYGPWGILISPFTGSEWLTLVMMGRVAMSAFVLAGIVLVARFESDDQQIKIVGAIGIAVLLLCWFTGHRESFFLAPAILVAFQRLNFADSLSDSRSRMNWSYEEVVWIGLTILAAWVSLAKFNLLLVSSLCYFLMLVADIRRRRLPMISLVFLFAVCFFWLAAGQHLTNFPKWVAACINLSLGYSDAMAKGFFNPYGPATVLAFYLAVLLSVIGIFFSRVHRWFEPNTQSYWILFAAISAIATKHGFGGNQMEQALVVLGMSSGIVTYQALSPGFANGWHGMSFLSRLALTSFGGAFLCMAVVASQINFPILGPTTAVASVQRNYAQLSSLVFDERQDLWRTQLATFHKLLPLSLALTDVNATIDVYPHQGALVVGRAGMRYQPRPAFMSLNAHTQTLVEINARRLDASTAPQYVLFQLLPQAWRVNSRHPATSDGPSWPHLLAEYSVAQKIEGFLLLRRRAAFEGSRKRLLVEEDITFDQSISLERFGGRMLWVELDVSRSVIGDIIHFLYKSPHVTITSQVSGGQSQTFQLLPSLAKAGFLLSPSVIDTDGFAELFLDPSSLPAVHHISISAPGNGAGFWGETIRLRVYQLDVD